MSEAEKRISDLERQLFELNTKIKSYFWLLGAVGFIGLGLFGYTNFFSVPGQVNTTFQDSAVQKTIDLIEANKRKSDQLSEQVKENLEKASAVATRLGSGNLIFAQTETMKDGGNCTPVAPPCPEGFTDTGLKLNNIGGGGDCGKGEVWRICYKYQ